MENLLNRCHSTPFPDATRHLPPKCVDHTICDPPYEVEAHSGQVRAVREAQSQRLESVSLVPGLSFEPLSDDTRAEFASEMVRVTRGWVILFAQAEAVGKWRDALRCAGATYKRACIWIKPNAMPQFSGDRPGQGYEMFPVAWCSPGRSVWYAGGKVGNYVHPIPRGEDRYHETQKPFGLMREILNDFTKPGEIILDPFAGSGTTLLAAKKLERKFIGFEKNEEYCKLANERLADPFFEPEAKQNRVQLSLL